MIKASYSNVKKNVVGCNSIETIGHQPYSVAVYCADCLQLWIKEI